MAENHIRGRGKTKSYGFGQGNQLPGEAGPFVGIVKNNIDPTRAARLQVYIEQFGGPDELDQTNWRTVNYLPPFFGSTEHSGASVGSGNFVGNKHSYGMWFTPPDIGTKVLCFFVSGDPGNGYYVGCIPEDSLNHMVPAIGSAKEYEVGEGAKSLLTGATQVPVTEINNEDPAINENPLFFKQPKPVHDVLAGSLFNQGLLKDNVRGPITSTAQRESPSNVFGVSTPGKPIYSGVNGADQSSIRSKLQSGELKPEQVKVVGRNGGHSIVLDDGDLEGNDQLVRIRTAKGHQIIMSDDGNCFHIIHANGQSWLEFGQEGTVDVFATNSVNVRTQGTINLHADKDINMYAGGHITSYSQLSTRMEAQTEFSATGIAEAKLYSKQFAGVRSDNTAAIEGGKLSSMNGGDRMDIKAGIINLNNGGGVPVSPNVLLKKNKVSDTVLSQNGWEVEYSTLETIATRVPSHEPWPYHNLGVENSVQLGKKETAVLGSAVATKVANVDSKLPTNEINASDFAKQQSATKAIGSLDEDQLTGLIAQRANDVGQEFTDISADKGVGAYGISPDQLETAGFLKPGTVSRYIKDPASSVTDGFGTVTTQLESVLKNPNVWTGKGGTNNLLGFLNNKIVQTLAQQDVLSTSLSTLKAKGIVTGNESPVDLGGILQASSAYGADAVATWANSQGGNSLINAGIEQTARNGKYAINFIDTKISNLSKSFSNPGAFAGTTDRETLDNNVSKIIADQRAIPPKYTR